MNQKTVKSLRESSGLTTVNDRAAFRRLKRSYNKVPRTARTLFKYNVKMHTQALIQSALEAMKAPSRTGKLNPQN
jgi:hypothetical protein